MASAASGTFHTITLSDEGIVHSFGHNTYGQSGLGHEDGVLVPSAISNLPKIKQVACGQYFTVCADYEGYIWSFGRNEFGQLGIGRKKTKTLLVPTKIQDIPPVRSVACGSYHTLMITNDSNLWSCGKNDFGQLCLKNQENQTAFQQTAFSDISKVSLGSNHSLFQNYKGEIYSCGRNMDGELGLGHFNHPHITPTLIPNLPSNIVQFVCGYQHNLFLDSDGNVFSVGCNARGQLGLGYQVNLNELERIQNIPPIQSISCSYSSYLIDFEGNVWSFGENDKGQLGHGDTKDRNIPTKIEGLKNIQHLSYGSCAYHFLAKDYLNKIFVTGFNGSQQLGSVTGLCCLTPKLMDSKYFPIWGNLGVTATKNARK